MDKSLVMTVIGNDRPGLVETLARTVSEHGGNWMESRMSHLAGKFAGIVRVTVAADRVSSLVETLRGEDLGGLTVIAEPGAEAPPPAATIRLELIGADHIGIIRDIAALLHQLGANVEELTSDCIDAPMSAQMLFKATVLLKLPPEVSETDLRDALEDLASDLVVDIHVAGPVERDSSFE